MLLEILLAIVLGVIAGIITGLTPGIHVNLVSVLLVSAAPLLATVFPPIAIAVVIIALATTHSFLDPLPSIFLGAPDSDTALGVLPGHRYLLKGKGGEAMMLTLLGSWTGLITSLLLLPLFAYLTNLLYPHLSSVMGYLLLLIAGFMVLRDRKPLWAILIFLLAGMLGVIVFELPLHQPLFPLLTGIFGIATLLYSINATQSLPAQQPCTYTVPRRVLGKAVGAGVLSGWITAVLPGVGAATAAVLSLQVVRRLGDAGFLILLGAISTVNFSLSLATLYVLDKARNGALIAVQQLITGLPLTSLLMFGLTALVVGSIAVHLGRFLIRPFSALIRKVDYKRLVLGVIAFLIIMTAILDGWLGLLVLLPATAIGLLPAIKKVSRVQAMGCLLIPVISYFLF